MNKHMIWDRQLHALIPNNPIVVRDLRHQQRTTSFRRGLFESVGIVAIALQFVVAMLWYTIYQPLDDRRFFTPIQILAWAFHIAAALRLIAAGVFVITPDAYLLNSDDLKVTPLSNWQLLLGKWWAAMHQVRGWMLALGIVHLGIVVVVTVIIVVSAYNGASSRCPQFLRFYYECIREGMAAYQGAIVIPTQLTLLVASAVGIAFLETASCTALGLVIVLVTRSKLGYIYAVALRFAPVFIFSIWPDSPWTFGIFERRFYEYTWFSFADVGTGALLRLAWGFPSFEAGLLSLCAAVGMFLLYISLSLVTAWAVMRRSRR